MPKKNNHPRRGSLQYRPRKRAKSIVARVRNWPSVNDAKVLGFAGYKVGMTHVIVQDTRANSRAKGGDVSVPVTVVECPPLRVVSVLLYKKFYHSLRCFGQINAKNLDKSLFRVLPPNKKNQQKSYDEKDVVDVRILVHTQPRRAFGKKTPEVFELGLGGKVEDKLKLAKDLLGKEINVKDVFKQGDFADVFAVTKGKGFQGPVKRFGVMIRQHKSEKAIRNPGSLGPWHGNRPWTVPHAGQQGFHQRAEQNKQILLIGDDPKKINVKGGFLRYGFVKNPYILVKGSVSGAVKRLVTFVLPKRVSKFEEVPPIAYVSLASKQ
ncbi:50S ribosomal protein L3 [Nanoarchaeota archaeon]|nr:MAG: 50S ribosomal protein L3 [Nanoarchaeota archaeon]